MFGFVRRMQKRRTHRLTRKLCYAAARLEEAREDRAEFLRRSEETDLVRRTHFQSRVIDSESTIRYWLRKRDELVAKLGLSAEQAAAYA